MISQLKTMLPNGVKRKLKHLMGFQSMDTRLVNLRRAGFTCTGAVDVGAYHGDWSRSLRSIWNAPIIMVEPQPSCKPVLEKMALTTHGAPLHLESCALGKAGGQVEFLLQETNSRISQVGEPSDLPAVRVPVVTLKELIQRYAERFNLLKVDVQGFELAVLEGAAEILGQFEVIVLEVSMIRIGPVPTFYEVMQYMDSRGYRLYDFLPMYYRPLDNALWQGDAFFVRNDSSLVSSLSWR